MAKFCSNCGVELIEGADGCIKCGKLISKEPVATSNMGSAGKKFCAYCGTELSDTADLCTNCGKLVNKSTVVSGTENKSRLVAGLLAVIFGSIGIHEFYLGYTKKGIIHLVIFFGGIWLLGIGVFASWIWAIIEAIAIFTDKNYVDADGLLLKDNI